MPSVGDVKSRLTIDSRPFTKGIKDAAKETKSLGNEGQKSSDKFKRGIKNAEREVGKFNTTLKRLGGTIIAAFGIRELTGFAQSSIQASVTIEGMERAFTALQGSSAKSAESIRFVVSESNRLGLSFEEAGSAFKRLTAATAGSSLSGQTQQIFTQIAEASNKIGVNTAELERVLVQVGQSATRGLIQTNELASIADAGLPAFLALANAMGVSVQEVDKLVQSGAAVSSQFLIPMLEEINKLAGDVKTFDTFAGRVNKLKTSFFLLSAETGKVLKDSDFLNESIGFLTDIFNEMRGVLAGTTVATSAFGKSIVFVFKSLNEELATFGRVFATIQIFRDFDARVTGKIKEVASELIDDVKAALGFATRAQKAALDAINNQPRGSDITSGATVLDKITVTGKRPSTPPPPILPPGLERSLATLDELFKTTQGLGDGFRRAREESDNFLSLLQAKVGLVSSELEKAFDAPGKLRNQDRIDALTKLLDGLQTRIDLEKTLGEEQERNRQGQQAALKIEQFRVQIAKERQQAIDAVKLSVETPRERFDRSSSEIRSLGLGGETEGRALAKLRDEFAKTLPAVQALESVFQSIGQTFQTSLQGIIQGTQSVGQAFKQLGRNILLSLANAALQAAISNITRLLSSSLGGGGSLSGTAARALVGGITSQARGTVTNGEQLSVIGDNPGGREFVVPSQVLSEPMQRFLARSIQAGRPLDTPSFATGGMSGGSMAGGMDSGLNLILVDDRDTAARREKEIQMIDRRVMTVVLDDIDKGRGSAVKRRFERAGR